MSPALDSEDFINGVLSSPQFTNFQEFSLVLISHPSFINTILELRISLSASFCSKVDLLLK
jgi:hypothetical protein